MSAYRIYRRWARSQIIVFNLGGTLSNPLGSASVPLVLVSGPLDFRQGCTPSMLAIVVGPHGFELARPEFERSIALSPRTPVLVRTRQCWCGAPNLEIASSRTVRCRTVVTVPSSRQGDLLLAQLERRHHRSSESPPPTVVTRCSKSRALPAQGGVDRYHRAQLPLQLLYGSYN